MENSVVNYQLSLSETGADHQTDMERYRSGHNEAVLKTVCPKGRVGSNPTLSARAMMLCEYNVYSFGEVPKLAEGTPLERVQVVNSGARVQIPPSPLTFLLDY